MNRSLANVLFGAFGAAPEAGPRTAAGLTVHAITPEGAAIQVAWAREVIVVPGYGMAVAHNTSMLFSDAKQSLAKLV